MTTPRRSARRPARPATHLGDAGVVTIELVAMLPVFVLVLLLLLGFARVEQSRIHVTGAAHAAARSASLARTPTAGTAAASSTASSTLAGSGDHLRRRPARISPHQPVRPGGVVTVTITCTVWLGDLTSLPVPGSIEFVESGSSNIETYRGSR